MTTSVAALDSLQTMLQQQLTKRRDQNLYRRQKVLARAPGPMALVDNCALLTFSSNDYLGLATHPKVIAAQQRGAELGAGATAAHLINGHLQVHQQLENKIAKLTGREAALLFSSGYMANVGTITALIKRGDFILQDKLNHASLIDGGRLSGARSLRFAHNDLEVLERQLQRAHCERAGGNILLAVDGVYSMDGDRAPLAEIAALCTQYNTWLMVDEAHGFGIMGSDSHPFAGSAAAAGLSPLEAPIIMGTLGKAAGNSGAFIAGSKALIDYLRQFARTYIYTTALPPAVAAGSLVALEIMQREPHKKTLWQLIHYFRQRAQQLKLPLAFSDSAIQLLPLGCVQTTMAVMEQLQHMGFLVGAIRPPTVPAGSSRLRITLCANHNRTQIDQLLQALAEVLRQRQLLHP